MVAQVVLAEELVEEAKAGGWDGKVVIWDVKPGKLVEIGATDTIFSNPKVKATEDYVTGRFG